MKEVWLLSNGLMVVIGMDGLNCAYSDENLKKLQGLSDKDTKWINFEKEHIDMVTGRMKEFGEPKPISK